MTRTLLWQDVFTDQLPFMTSATAIPWQAHVLAWRFGFVHTPRHSRNITWQPNSQAHVNWSLDIASSYSQQVSVLIRVQGSWNFKRMNHRMWWSIKRTGRHKCAIHSEKAQVEVLFVYHPVICKDKPWECQKLLALSSAHLHRLQLDLHFCKPQNVCLLKLEKRGQHLFRMLSLFQESPLMRGCQAYLSVHAPHDWRCMFFKTVSVFGQFKHPPLLSSLSTLSTYF